MARMIWPAPAKLGDTIGLIAPSGANREAGAVERYAANLVRLGFRVKAYPCCQKAYGYLAGTDAERAKEFMDAFADPETAAIVCMRGGYGTARLLPLIDFDFVAAHPKRMIGFSDITALHAALQRKSRMVSFHGPMPMYLNEGKLDSYTKGYFLDALLGEKPCAALVNPADDPIRVLASGSAEGEIAGGNLTLVASLLGTPWSIDFVGKLLFLEDVGEHTYRLDGYLTNLRNAGAFELCAAVVFGQFTECENEYPEYGFTLEQIVRDLVVPSGKPVFLNARFGHCAPQMTLPMGARAAIEGATGRVRLL